MVDRESGAVLFATCAHIRDDTGCLSNVLGRLEGHPKIVCVVDFAIIESAIRMPHGLSQTGNSHEFVLAWSQHSGMLEYHGLPRNLHRPYVNVECWTGAEIANGRAADSHVFALNVDGLEHHNWHNRILALPLCFKSELVGFNRIPDEDDQRCR